MSKMKKQVKLSIKKQWERDRERVREGGKNKKGERQANMFEKVKPVEVGHRWMRSKCQVFKKRVK